MNVRVMPLFHSNIHELMTKAGYKQMRNRTFLQLPADTDNFAELKNRKEYQ